MDAAIGFSWSSIVPTVVGGFISAVSAVGMFYLAQRTERKKRAAEKRKEEALNAFQGFWKLRHVANGLWNYDRQLTECYKEAAANGDADIEPFAKVKPFVGAADGYEALEPRETLFLGRQKKIELLNEIDLVVRRARNIEAVVEKYNEQKASFAMFIEENADELVQIDGPMMGATFKGKLGVVAEARAGSMNNLLGQLHEHLDADYRKARKITEDYLAAARAEFGADFPKFNFEWLES